MASLDASIEPTADSDHVMLDLPTNSTSNGLNPHDASPPNDLDATSDSTTNNHESSSGISNGSSQYPPDNIISPTPPSTTKFSPLPYSSSRTGLVYDVRMRFHCEPIPKEADMHPEDPRRIYEVYNELCQAGLVDDPANVDPNADFMLLRIPTRYATEHEIRACHSHKSWDFVMSLKDWDEVQLQEVGDSMDSVYLSVNTPGAALLAAGGAIEASRAVMNGQVKNSIAVIRPPGHHAEHDYPMGFCFFNNVPVAARAMQRQFGVAARKILILDWDVHHGNGVQNIFYDDPNVLYISLHVSEGGRFYPSGDGKDLYHCGEGAGLGKNVNIPWKTRGMRDGDYLYAFQKVVMPIAQDFDPDLVMVCAGFDAAEGDMIGGCHVSPAGYAHMTHMLMSLAGGKLVVCMEGGYNLRAISVSALAVTRTLMGEPPERLGSFKPSRGGVEVVADVLCQQSNFWPCLLPKDPSQRLVSQKAVRIHDMMREAQAIQLFKSHQMTSLFIARTEISKSFENQVLATQNYASTRPLLLIIHDPPKLTAVPDNYTSNFDSHNAWLTDGVRKYIDWAGQQDFAIIDVNVPLHLTEEDDDHSRKDVASRTERAKQAYLLATYLWENYIELEEHSHLFIIGVGAAYASILDLLRTNQRVSPRVSKVFMFVSEQSLISCRSPNNDTLASWYHDHSLVFVSQSHAVWETHDPEKRHGDVSEQTPREKSEKKRKSPSRAFGTVVKTTAEELDEMLFEQFHEVTSYMAEITGLGKSDV